MTKCTWEGGRGYPKILRIRVDTEGKWGFKLLFRPTPFRELSIGGFLGQRRSHGLYSAGYVRAPLLPEGVPQIVG